MELKNMWMGLNLKDISRMAKNMAKEYSRATMKNSKYGKTERRSQID